MRRCEWVRACAAELPLTAEPKRVPHTLVRSAEGTMGEHALDSELAEVWIMIIKSNSITT